ncbi:MAG: hypothetical protein DHS20C15_09720 [Planctomycetota bacterium]|nr:MAG: hypothetical protein DHS20C15_09720 [Planctomycetota bacterium]
MTLHAPYFLFLAIVLAWNLWAARGARGFERWTILPLQLALTVVLLRDRFFMEQPAWLLAPGVALLFPALFALGLLQNGRVWRTRGEPRLTEFALLAFNLVVGACVALVAAESAGWSSGPKGAVLLADYALLQDLLGHRLAHEWTLCWHLPFLFRRRAPSTLPGAFMGLFPAALAAFSVILLGALLGSSAHVIESFASEPQASPRVQIPTGVWMRADEASASAPPGALQAWVLPADHSGNGLPEVAPDTLVLALRAPESWTRERPEAALAADVFRTGALRLAARLRPRLLLPYPEPDGEGTAFFGPDITPEQWATWLQSTRAALREVSPNSLLGVRLASTSPRGRRLFSAFATTPDCVDVLGPRLSVGGVAPAAAGFAAATLDTWEEWSADLVEPPALWILAAGLSPLAYGERAQEQFLLGVLARAETRGGIEAVLLDGWRDRGRTRGLLRADGSSRPAGIAVAERLSSQGARRGR